MLTLLKNIECYCPQYIGQRNILIACDKIYKIQTVDLSIDTSLIDNIMDCDGLMAFPGIIDQHVHIVGGGGEEGFVSRIPEIDFHNIILAGVSTLVGLLGIDSYTKSLESLLAKSRALEQQGLTTYIYTGSYAVPIITLTKSIISDIVLIDKVIGTGEIAISDHRSSHPSQEDFIKLASDTHIGGIVSGKPGVVHIHVGNGKDGLEPLLQLVRNSDYPIEMFVPTHVNRNRKLFEQAIEYCRIGGNIDLTAGEVEGISVPDAIQILIDQQMDLSRVTISSDANGSGGAIAVSQISSLYEDIKSCITVKGMSPTLAFGFVTENVARILKLHPKKGVLKDESDADILILDKNFDIKELICRGKLLMNN